MNADTDDAAPTETTLWRKAANHSQGWRAVGGHLTLSIERLIFSPHAVDRNTGGDRIEIDLADVAEVGVTERELRPSALMSGAFRHRLIVTTRTGAVELFVINQTARVAADIEAARTSA